MHIAAPVRLLPLAALTTAFVATAVAHAAAQVTPRASDQRSGVQLSATAEQGGVVTYSEPIDVRRHAVWNDRRARPDLRTLRIAGSVRNEGEAPVRVMVFAIAESEYATLSGSAAARMSARTGYISVVPVLSIDIGPSTVEELSGIAPRDPARLERLMRAGPVRLGMVAEPVMPGRVVSVFVWTGGAEMGRSEPLSPLLTSRSGSVSLVDARTLSADAFLSGTSHYHGSRYYPSHQGAW
jgi:hypothetical protein